MSSTILTVIVLVVMWMVVLVPMFVRRGDELLDDQSDDLLLDSADDDEGAVGADGMNSSDAADSGDVLAGHPSTERLSVRTGRRVSHTHRVEDLDDLANGDDADPGQLPEENLDEAVAVDGATGDGHAARYRMLARRRRALTGLGACTLATLLLVAVTGGGSGAWTLQVLCDLMLAGYLVGLRREVRRERVRRAVRLARRTAARARVTARRNVRTRPPAPSAPPPRRRAVGGYTPSDTGHPGMDDIDEDDDPLTHRRVV